MERPSLQGGTNIARPVVEPRIAVHENFTQYSYAKGAEGKEPAKKRKEPEDKNPSLKKERSVSAANTEPRVENSKDNLLKTMREQKTSIMREYKNVFNSDTRPQEFRTATDEFDQIYWQLSDTKEELNKQEKLNFKLRLDEAMAKLKRRVQVLKDVLARTETENIIKKITESAVMQKRTSSDTLSREPVTPSDQTMVIGKPGPWGSLKKWLFNSRKY